MPKYLEQFYNNRLETIINIHYNKILDDKQLTNEEKDRLIDNFKDVKCELKPKVRKRVK